VDRRRDSRLVSVAGRRLSGERRHARLRSGSLSRSRTSCRRCRSPHDESARQASPVSRHDQCPSSALRGRHSKGRAQGRPGADRTRGPRATRKHAAEPQVRAEQPAFPAQWLYGLYALSSVHPAVWPPSSADHRLRTWHQRWDARTTRFRRPTRIVRPLANLRAATPIGHRIPRPTFVTIAKRPSSRVQDGGNKTRFL